MCNDEGGIVDDVVVYRQPDGYMVVINAACRPKDVAWMGAHSAECTFEDIGDEVALLAVQGPRAVALVNRLCAADVAEVRPFHSTDTQVAGVQAPRPEPGTRGRTASSSTSDPPTPRVSGTRSSTPEPRTA